MTTDAMTDAINDEEFSDVLGGDLAVQYGIEGDTKMTPEAIFVEEYLRSGNAFMACNKSGLVDARYPMEVVARRTLERPEIQAAIALGKKLQARNGRRDPPGMYSREMILDELQRIHEQSLADKSYASSINAVKAQAQMLGFLDQTVNVNHRVSAKELSLDDLRRMVSESRAGDDAIDVTPVVKGIGGE